METPAENGCSGGRRLPEETARWCAVTGGRGFMARHLVAALLRSGEWRVRVTDLSPAITLDPVEEKGLLGAALRDGRAVYAPANVCDIAQLTEGTKNVIDACVTSKVKRLIYTSSSAVVFDGVHGLFDVDESMPYPDKFPDAYARSKAEAENLVIKANDIYELLTCSIRPGSIFGPGDNIVPHLLSHGGMMFIIGDGKNCDDFVYVENVVHGHICAEKTISTKEGSKVSGGKAYFITNMEPMNFWDFLYTLSDELGYKRKFRTRIPLAVIRPITYLIEWSYSKVLSMYGMHPPKVLTSARLKYISLNRTFNCKRAVEQLGYKPIVSIKDGIKITTNNAIVPKM